MRAVFKSIEVVAPARFDRVDRRRDRHRQSADGLRDSRGERPAARRHGKGELRGAATTLTESELFGQERAPSAQCTRRDRSSWRSAAPSSSTRSRRVARGGASQPAAHPPGTGGGRRNPDSSRSTFASWPPPLSLSYVSAHDDVCNAHICLCGPNFSWTGTYSFSPQG